MARIAAPAEAALGPSLPPPPRVPHTKARGWANIVGGGIITGAADDDPSAIGTYASAGARFGYGFLWIAPVLLPMMFVVTYLAGKLGRVYGKGLFGAVRDRYPRRLLYPLMAGAFIGNGIEAAANMGGVAAALELFVPLPVPALVAIVAVAVLLLQLVGSYDLIRTVFRWLALALFSYVAAALLAKPDWGAVARATFVPHVEFSAAFLAMIVACIGTSLSAYVYTWQSNQEVEDQIAEGRRHWWQRRGVGRGELARSRRDVMIGMAFANLILYAIILSTAATLHESGQFTIDSAAQAATALEPLAGKSAKLLFALGVIGVGFLAIPVMTTGAAYDLVQGVGGKGSLHHRIGEAPLFYGTIAVVTVAAIGLNLLGFNPIHALVLSGIVQGFSVPPLLLLMMLMTNDRSMMGENVNSPWINAMGWVTTAATFAATTCLVVLWLIGTDA